MTGRERLLATFRKEPIDRIAISPFLYYNIMYKYFGYVPSAESKNKIMDCFYDPEDFDPMGKFVEYHQHYGFDLLHNLGSDWWGWPYMISRKNWDVTTVIEDNGDDRHVTTVVRTPDGDIRQRETIKRSSEYLVVRAIDEYFVKTRKDFDVIRKYAHSVYDVDCSLVVRAQKNVGDAGMMSSCTGCAFNWIAVFRNLEDIFMDPIVDEGFYREMMEFATDAVIKQDLKLIECGVEVIEMTANLATSASGPGFYRDFVLEYDKRIIEEIHKAGAYVNYHNCGDSMKLLSLYNELGIDSLGYLTPPPFGDVDIDEALKIIDPGIILRGNIDQVEFLRKATPAEVNDKVKELLIKVKDRGNFILSTTDFIFDDTPVDNIKAFVEAGIEYGSY